jgi:hypothetical protein
LTDQTPGDLHLALAKLSEITAVGLAEIKGQLAMLMQRADHSDWRIDELAKRVDADRGTVTAQHQQVEARLDAVERDAITRQQLAERTRQIIAIVGLMVTIASVLVTVVLALSRT